MVVYELLFNCQRTLYETKKSALPSGPEGSANASVRLFPLMYWIYLNTHTVGTL
jgi:hypothetical protein